MEQRTTGTTIAACRFDGGVVLGCDTRMTMGSYICNRACEKIVPLYDNAFLCRCGSVADCQMIGDHVNSYVEQHAIAAGEMPDVKLVANLVKLVMYRNKHLLGGLIVAGWDEKHGGQVYGIPIGGTLVSENWMVDGSGSTYVWGVCDSMYKDNMTQQEAEEFVVTALSLAMNRDASSGGMARIVTMTAAGAERKLIKPRDFAAFPEELPDPMADTVMMD